ncbi:unnamed protein product [Penicillium olsonii]|uniref:Major facilitator superfamily (MFS) profile domain-containing protein n=1 Tax=Penicillium olsonii TaxID=99116 RepID=A0A9W4MMG5_PENOL|nr:unnamed protein product [Penicillium olsonii]
MTERVSERSPTAGTSQVLDPRSQGDEKNSSSSRTTLSPKPRDHDFNDRAEKESASLELTDETDQHQQADITDTHLAGWKFAILMIGLALTCICVALDNTIIATAIPKITDQFNSLDDVGWYGSAFLLTNCSVSLVYGKLYTYFSIKWVYLGALGIFELGSLICGIAPNSVALIIGRAIAGVGASGLFSGSVLIVADAAPIRQRPIWTSVISAIFSVAGVAGPIIGGALTDHATWRWCFYINLPLGGVSVLFLLLLYKAPKPVETRDQWKELLMQLDPLGLFFFMPSMISLLLALQWGGSKYAWNSQQIIGLFVGFGLMLFAFIAVQLWQQEQAMVSPRLIKNRNIWGGALYMFCTTAAFMVYTYYLPIWFQSVKGVSATKSGILNLPMLLGAAISSIITGGIVSMFGQYAPFLYFGSVVSAIAGGLLTTLQVDSGHAKYLGYQAMFGIGTGSAMMQPLMAVQAAAPPSDIPSATVIVMFMQSMGGAIFISAAQNLFHNKLLENLTNSLPGVDAKKVVEAGATMLRTVVPKEMLPTALAAYSSAITYSFYLAVAFSALSLLGAFPMQWLSLKKKKA